MRDEFDTALLQSFRFLHCLESKLSNDMETGKPVPWTKEDHEAIKRTMTILAQIVVATDPSMEEENAKKDNDE